MNILFIVPYIPNLIRVRPYNLIRFLYEQGNRITLVTLWENEEEYLDLEPIKPYCEHIQAFHLPRTRSLWNCLQAIPSRNPLQTVYSWQPMLAKHIENIMDLNNGSPPFDVVHVEHLRGVRYGLLVKKIMATRSSKIPIVWDSVDCISLLFRQAFRRTKKQLSRIVTGFELTRTERYERWASTQFDRILVTSKADLDAFEEIAGENNSRSDISILPNGVDLEYFVPDEEVTRAPASIVITGKMSYHANVTMCLHFVNEIMPLIRLDRPDVLLWIVGKDPSREVRELAKHPAITVTGTVEDVRPFLLRATLSVSPITYGAGIQNKVLEAMACATPVVSSPQAISALNVIPGKDLLVSNEPVGFAAAVLNLLANPTRQRQIGAAGRKYVETHHKWSSITSQLEEMYDELIHTYH